MTEREGDTETPKGRERKRLRDSKSLHPFASMFN